jgi:Tfp pilus assembly protein PilW
MMGSKKKAESCGGMTMVELLISIAAGAIVILGVYRLLINTLWNYNMQEQMTDMYQNGTYTIKRLSEVLAESGSYLPEKNYTVIYYSSGNPDSICMRINSKSAKFTFLHDTTCTDLRLDSAQNFIGADSLVNRDTAAAVNVTTVKINSVKTANTPDTISLAASTAFHTTDVIYGASTTRFFLFGTNFCKDTITNVLAENIEALGITFFDKSHAATTSWATMASCSLYVRARTTTPDPKYRNATYHDGYHRLALVMNLRLRNRF